MARNDDFTEQLRDMLDGYSDEVMDIVSETIDDIGKDMTRELKAISNKGEQGKFAKGWRKSVVASTRISTETVLHNRHYQLVHLLEHGHMIENGTGRTTGSTRAFKIIERVEDRFYPKITQEIGRRIEGLG